MTVGWNCPRTSNGFIQTVQNFWNSRLIQLPHARIDMLRIFYDRLLHVHRRRQLLQVIEVRQHFVVALTVCWMTRRAVLRRLRYHAAAVVRHLWLMMDLLLVVAARRGLRLTLLGLLDGTLFGTELFVLDFETRRFDVVWVVLLKFTSLNRAGFLEEWTERERTSMWMRDKRNKFALYQQFHLIVWMHETLREVHDCNENNDCRHGVV